MPIVKRRDTRALELLLEIRLAGVEDNEVRTQRENALQVRIEKRAYALQLLDLGRVAIEAAHCDDLRPRADGEKRLGNGGNERDDPRRPGGSVLVNRFGSALQEALPPSAAAVIPPEQLARIQNPQVLLSPQISASIREGLNAAGPQAAQAYDTLIAAIRTALAGALHETFVAGAVIVAVGAVAVLFLQEIPLRKSFADAPAAGASGSPGRDAGPVPPMAAATAPADSGPVA